MDKNLINNAIVWGTIGTELTGVVYDLRWMVLFAFALIFADFWWGYSESKVRYKEAVEANNHVLMEKYKWHKSRALRRTMNKTVDYITYLIVGAFLGLAITEPLDICGHVLSAAIGLLVGCTAEIASLVGHIAYVKYGVELKLSDIMKIVSKFALNLLKMKNKDLGNAVEETMKEKEYDKEQNLDD